MAMDGLVLQPQLLSGHWSIALCTNLKYNIYLTINPAINLVLNVARHLAIKLGITLSIKLGIQLVLNSAMDRAINRATIEKYPKISRRIQIVQKLKSSKSLNRQKNIGK